MNAPTLRRICAQSGSSFGSKTTHFSPRIEALFDEERGAAHRDVLPLAGRACRRRRACARPRPRGPTPAKERRAVHAEGIELTVLGVVERLGKPLHADQRGIDAGGRFPDAALHVGAGEDAGDRAGGREVFDDARLQRMERADPGVVERGVLLNWSGSTPGTSACSSAFRPLGESMISMARFKPQYSAAAAYAGGR